MALVDHFKDYVLCRFAGLINQNALSYRQTIGRITKEAVLLLEDGFEYDSKHNVFFKQIYIDGKYEGEYDMEIEFPKRFPDVPPLVFMQPKFKGKISPHIHSGSSGDVCIEGTEGRNNYRGGWWNENMNVMSAVKLAIMVANEEIDRKAPKQDGMASLKGTIFEEISKRIPKQDFVNFCSDKGIKVYNAWNWNQIAAKTQSASINFKKDMVRFLKGYKNGNKN